MAKAINWPEEFLEEVQLENKEELKIALRLGCVYHEQNYYHVDDIVDIRVGGKIVRKAMIPCQTKTMRIKDITTSDIYRLKEDLQNKESIVKFLSKTYNKEINEETVVTVITYKNLGLLDLGQDDPHC